MTACTMVAAQCNWTLSRIITHISRWVAWSHSIPTDITPSLFIPLPPHTSLFLSLSLSLSLSPSLPPPHLKLDDLKPLTGSNYSTPSLSLRFPSPGPKLTVQKDWLITWWNSVQQLDTSCDSVVPQSIGDQLLGNGPSDTNKSEYTWLVSFLT